MNNGDFEGQSIWAVHKRVQALLELGRNAEALALAQGSIGAHPDNYFTYCLMGQALLGMGKLDETERVAQRAAALAPEREWPQRLRAIVYFRRGRKIEALAVAQEMIRLGPDVRECLSLLASIQMACGHLGASDSTIERLAAVAPDWPTTHRMLGDRARMDKRWVAAEGHYRRGLAIDPRDADLMNNLGVALLSQRDRQDEAMACFHDAAKLDPTDPLHQKNLQLSINRYIGKRASHRGTVLQTLAIIPFLFSGGGFVVLPILAIRRLRAWYRLRQLPPELQVFYRSQRRQARSPRSRLRIVLIVAIVALIAGMILLAILVPAP